MKKIRLSTYAEILDNKAKAARQLGVSKQLLQDAIKKDCVFVLLDDANNVIDATTEKKWGKFK